jgi:hypothetical protein
VSTAWMGRLNRAVQACRSRTSSAFMPVGSTVRIGFSPNDIPKNLPVGFWRCVPTSGTRSSCIMERLENDPNDLLNEATELTRRARERAPQDSFVLSVASLITGVRQEDELALELALRAKRGDPNHAFVRQCLSVAWSFSGKPGRAHDEAIAARSSRLAILTPPIYYLRNAYTAIGIGDTSRALVWALMAVHASPNFRAAHRVVAALQYASGNAPGAETSLQALRRLEPDFSLDLMASDTYPVDTLTGC